jgi:transposase
MNQAKIKERELILKLAKENKTCRDIADILGTSKSKVSYWVCRSRKTERLSDMPRSGRPTKLSQEKMDMVYSALRQEESTSNRSGFSSKRVGELLRTVTQNEYSMRHVRRLLKKMGIGLITPEISHIKKDERKIKKFRRDFKKNSNRNIWTTYLSPSTK